MTLVISVTLMFSVKRVALVFFSQMCGILANCILSNIFYCDRQQRGPTLTTFFVVDDERRDDPNNTKVGHDRATSETPFIVFRW